MQGFASSKHQKPITRFAPPELGYWASRNYLQLLDSISPEQLDIPVWDHSQVSLAVDMGFPVSYQPGTPSPPTLSANGESELMVLVSRPSLASRLGSPAPDWLLHPSKLVPGKGPMGGKGNNNSRRKRQMLTPVLGAASRSRLLRSSTTYVKFLTTPERREVFKI